VITESIVGDTEAWNVILESNMDRGGDVARDMIVDTVAKGVRLGIK
jgi:hypothetical protein